MEMDVTGTSLFEVWNNLQDFTIVLNYAACELLLNFLLLVDAVFSYLLVKFAHHCKLQIPCILCSRLDHILDKKKHGFYRNQLCSNHRSELSSLFSCCIHGKLADGRGMCDECLLSFATGTKSNPDMQRLFVGKFGLDLSGYGCQSSSQNRELVPGPVDVRLCSCCNKPWTSRQKADKLYLPKSRRGTIKPSIPLPRQSTRHESSKEMKERFSNPAMPCQFGKFGFESLSNIRYKDLKITYDSKPEFPFSDDDEVYDSKPEFPFSDDDEVICVFHEMKKAKEEFKMKRASKVFPDTPTHHVAPDQLNNKSEADLDCNLHELKQKQTDQESFPSAVPELPLSIETEASAALSTEKCELKFHLSQNSKPSSLSDLMSLLDVPSSFNVVGDTLKALEWKSADAISRNKQEEILKAVTEETEGVANRVTPVNPAYASPSDAISSNGLEKIMKAVTEETGGVVNRVMSVNPAYMSQSDAISINEQEEIMKAVTEETGGLVNRVMPVNPAYMSQSDAISINEQEEILKAVTEETGGVANRVTPVNLAYMSQSDANAGWNSTANIDENETYAFVTKKATLKEPERFNEAVKLFPTENASTQRVDLYPEKIITCTDEPQILDAASSNRVGMLQDTVSPEKSQSFGLETFDKISINEIEGENVVKRLTQQVEYGRSCINTLYRELEEERNASAVAASQAMAMITRLQEEKAAIKMEALQCLRLMEEQVEYDIEELEKVNDLLAEKDKEIQDLEADLELYRSKFADVPVMQTKPEKEIDLVFVGNKISEVNRRLEALEIDWNFFENILNSLQIGKEGLHYAQEIAHQLQELRKFMTKITSQLVP